MENINEEVIENGEIVDNDSDETIIITPVKNKIPWQISTTGIVIGFFIGIVPILISLLGNHQYKQGKDISELIKAYNIILIIMIALLGVVVFIFLLIFVIAIFSAIALV